MATPTDSPKETQQLRQSLHEEIDQLPPAHLASFGQTVQEWELGLRRRQLDAGYEPRPTTPDEFLLKLT